MKFLKTDKLTLALMLLAVVGMLVYLWGSQYYYPSNYLPAAGQAQAGIWYNRGETNYYIDFQTQTGQDVTYMYQTFDPIKPTSPIALHYNSSNPKQVRIKPSRLELAFELILGIVLIPGSILLASNRVKRYGLRGLLSKPR